MNAFLPLILLAAVYAATLALLPWFALSGEITAPFLTDHRAAWMLAITVYLASHLLRIGRLSLLLLDTGKSVREIASANFSAALATLIIPFRLGDIVRLAEYYRVAGARLVPALSTYLVERFFDASILLLIGLIAALSHDGSMHERQLVLGLVVIVWLLFMITYVTLPRALRNMRIALLTRGRGTGSINWLRLLGMVEDTWMATRHRIKDRSALLWLVSMLIWCAELSAFSLAGNVTLTSSTAGEFLATLERGLEPGSGAGQVAMGYPALVLQTLALAGLAAIPFALRGWFLLGQRMRHADGLDYELLQEMPQ